MSDMEGSRYPVGRFEQKPLISKAEREEMIRTIADFPALMREAVAGLDDHQLDTPYRPGGWTVRQVVHHVADSHVNSYVRFKLAMTEDLPTIRPYDEGRWAELDDARSGPVELSLTLLEPLHRRWVVVLRSIPSDRWSDELLHPESGRLSLDTMLQLYAWHCRHHLAHVRRLRERMGWR